VTKTLRNLSKWARRFTPALEKAVNEKVKETVLDLQSELVRVTPVDTSQALSNWQVELHAKTPGSRPAFRVGMKGSTATYSRQQAMSKARGAVKSRKNGVPVFTSNELDYMEELNNPPGKSRQAAPGFIEAATRRVWARSKQRKLKIKV
jgi:hypothetical protein